MDWRQVELTVGRGERSVWDSGLRHDELWFRRILCDYDFWLIWQGVGFIRDATGEVFPLRRGVCLFMRPGGRHEAWQEDGSQLGVSFVHFQIDSSPTGSIRGQQLPGFHLETANVELFETVTSCLFNLRQEAAFLKPDRKAENTRLRADLVRLLMQTFTYEQSQGRVDAQAGIDRERRQRVSRALARLHAGFRDRLDVTRLAAEVGCGRDSFHMAFKQITGTTPHRALTVIRIDRAKELLRQGGMNVGEVSHRVGYESVFHFSRLFRREVGCAPSAYRTRSVRRIADGRGIDRMLEDS